MTNAQGWTATKAFGTASNGFSKQAILSGNLTNGFYNSLAGLALSFESIDILEEPVSFNGLRQEVSSKLPDLIKTAESIDPTKGAAIKALMYRSLVGQSGQYDRRIESDESKLGIAFNPKTRTYNLDSNTSDDTRLTLIGITNKHYNGNLVAAIEDGFKRTTLEDLSLLPSTKDAASLSEGGMNNAKQMLSSKAPQVDDVKNIFDLRSSSVYLKNLSLQIEPKASKDAREIARESVSAIETPSEIPLESITGFERIANDTAFLGAVERVSQDLGISNSDLLTAISFETVGTFNPSIKNPESSARGLIQFIEKTAKSLGTSTAELAKMNNVEQMEYVKRYLEPQKGRMKNLGDVYMAIHWPAGIGKDDSYVMYRKGSKYYKPNRKLDTNGDGTVTRGEALQRVRQMQGGGRGAPITMSELPAAPVSDTAEVSPVSAGAVPTVDVAQPEVVVGQAVLPEQDAEAVAEAEAETKAPAVTTTPPEIEALIEALGERSLTNEEAQQFREYMSTLKVNAGG